MVVVTADVPMDAAGDGNAVLFVGGADGRPVVRHRHDDAGRRDRTLDRIGRRIGAGEVDRLDVGFRFGVDFRIGAGRGRGICRCLLLQLVELLLHQSQLLLQKRDFGIRPAGRLRLRA